MACCGTVVDPCNCLASSVVVPTCPTTCSSSTNCIRPVNALISCVDSVAPGGVGIYDVSTLSVFTVCPTVTYQIVSFDADHYSSVVISAGGVITFTLSATATPGTYGEIIYMISCIGKDLAALGTLQVCARSLCWNVICPEGEVCNPITGECEPEIPDLSIE